MKKLLHQAILDRPLLADGAMGTELMAAGLEQNGCGEQWNLTEPARVLAIQRRYVEAGADCVLTNTFGASRIALDRHGLGSEAAAINRAAVEIVREAFGTRGGYIIGDIGPFGGLMEPYGDVAPADVRAALLEQARALVDAGADALLLETQTSLDELLLGIEAAQEAGARSVIGSMAFNVAARGPAVRTMMGVDPERAAAFMQQHGVDIIALNCGGGMNMEQARRVVARYRAVSALPVMVQPGQPTADGDRLIYAETPEQMAAGVVPLLEAGAAIVGGCCGSTPAHIRAFRAAMDGWVCS